LARRRVELADPAHRLARWCSGPSTLCSSPRHTDLDAELLMLDLRRFPIFADLEPAGR
jgi:hypothetical protein